MIYFVQPLIRRTNEGLVRYEVLIRSNAPYFLTKYITGEPGAGMESLVVAVVEAVTDDFRTAFRERKVKMLLTESIYPGYFHLLIRNALQVKMAMDAPDLFILAHPVGMTVAELEPFECDILHQLLLKALS